MKSPNKATKPKITGEVRKGGGVPDGFEQLKSVNVYAKPGSADKPIKKTPGQLQGVWCVHFNAVNPQEVWIFNKDQEPPKLIDSGHPIGNWGYKPGVDDPQKCAVEDMWFFPPKAKHPKYFTPRGIWTFPLMKRDEEALEPDSGGFLHVGDATKKEALDVGGRWRMLYQRPGEEKPSPPPPPPPPPKDMKVHVKKPNGDKITLTVKPTDTIDNIKDKVTDRAGIPKDEQRLRHCGKPLDDKPTLDDYGIEDGAILNLEPMEIFVKDWNGKKYTLVVEPTSTIDNVKNKLENQEDIPKEDQRLTFAGNPCVDKKNLREHGIKHRSVLDLLPMVIYVQDPKGKKYTLENVEPNNSITQIKAKLESQEGIPKKQQRLTYNDKPCIDKKNLRDHGIKHKSVLHLEPMQIHIKTPNGKKLTLDVEPTDTINDIKNRVKNKENIPKDEQRMEYKNKPMDDDRATLDDEGINHGDTIDMQPMTIYVQDPKGKRYTLNNVDPEDTIDTIKAKLESQEGIPKKKQRLTYNDKPCIDKKNLRDHGVRHKSVLHLEPMEIYVRTPQGKKLTFDVEPTDTVQSIKDRVERKENIPIDEQRLLFRKEPLNNDRATLEDEGLQHKDTLDLEPMHVIIKDWTGKKFPVYCEPDDTIESIKDKIEDQEGHPKPIQFLIFGGNFLEDPKTLRNYGIKHKNVINLDRMKIYVKDWKGKTFTLEVDPKENIEDVKKMIEDREGLPVPEQILKFRAQKMDDPKNLDDYGVKYKDTLELSKDMPPEPSTPPQNTFTVQLTPYKSPFGGYSSPKKTKKRDGVRAPTKEQFKDRWHTDLANETVELGNMMTEQRRKEMQDKKSES